MFLGLHSAVCDGLPLLGQFSGGAPPDSAVLKQLLGSESGYSPYLVLRKELPKIAKLAVKGFAHEEPPASLLSTQLHWGSESLSLPLRDSPLLGRTLVRSS